MSRDFWAALYVKLAHDLVRSNLLWMLRSSPDCSFWKQYRVPWCARLCSFPIAFSRMLVMSSNVLPFRWILVLQNGRKSRGTNKNIFISNLRSKRSYLAPSRSMTRRCVKMKITVNYDSRVFASDWKLEEFGKYIYGRLDYLEFLAMWTTRARFDLFGSFFVFERNVLRLLMSCNSSIQYYKNCESGNRI